MKKFMAGERPRWFGAAIEQNNMRPGAILPPPEDVYTFRRCVVDEVVAKEVMAVRTARGDYGYIGFY